MFTKIEYFNHIEISRMEAELASYDLDFDTETHSRHREAFSDALNQFDPVRDEKIIEALVASIGLMTDFNRFEKIEKEYKQKINALVTKREELEELAEEGCDNPVRESEDDYSCGGGAYLCDSCSAKEELENLTFPEKRI